VPADQLSRILVERQFLTPGEAGALLESAQAARCFPEEILIRDRRLTAGQLRQILENEFFCPGVRLQDAPSDPGLLAALPRQVAATHLALPIRLHGEAVQVAFADPADGKTRGAVAGAVGRQLVPLVALRHELRDAIARRYDDLERGLAASAPPNGRGASRAAAGRKPAPLPAAAAVSISREDERSMPALVDRLIEEAVSRGITDIHLEPKERELVIRFRLDGILFRAATLRGELASAVVSRVKILGGMDIAERRLPQDGRCTVTKGDTLLDLRISSVPSAFGEKVVIRLLSKAKGLLDLDSLRMPPAVREGYGEALRSAQGLYLVAGPTGSGKTTTLYATLNALDCESVNIVTLEDPIEYSLPGLTQVQVMEEIGLTFGAGLRAFLRQDPDVILVGEIRDAQTVEIACRAALTGHKVFSTIHTSGAAQAVPRLVDMGVPAYLIAATLRGVLAQRLVRVLCPACTEAYPPTPAELAVLGYPKIAELHRGAGCSACSGTGFKGRIGIYEYLPITEPIVKLIVERASSFAIQYAAKQHGMIPLAEFAKRAVVSGLTTVAEIQRAVLADEGHEQLCRRCKQVVSLEFAVCPFCQAVLKEQCTKCGHPLDPEWEACPRCGQEADGESRKRYCPHCQAPLAVQHGSCPFCGGGL
jgi:type II secretory ATPase GspE/PulE/Tfp pilus assembly ATPase PilB-like protein/RNA polymerase subunit RPABC4/transcription elongation factor Spt4